MSLIVASGTNLTIPSTGLFVQGVSVTFGPFASLVSEQGGTLSVNGTVAFNATDLILTGLVASGNVTAVLARHPALCGCNEWLWR